MDYAKFFDDVVHLAKTTDWKQDDPRDNELWKEAGGMIYTLLFWLRYEGGVWCDFIYSAADDPCADHWHGETVNAPTVAEAFHKSLEVNNYLLRG